MKTTNQFSINTAEKCFSGEMSELRGFDRLYDDACDIGVVLESMKTGVVSKWFIRSTEMTDGDTLWWELIPDEKSIRQSPALNGWKMMIFND